MVLAPSTNSCSIQLSELGKTRRTDTIYEKVEYILVFFSNLPPILSLGIALLVEKTDPRYTWLFRTQEFFIAGVTNSCRTDLKLTIYFSSHD